MNEIKVKPMVYVGHSTVESYLGSLTSAFKEFIEENELKYIAINQDRDIGLFSSKPNYNDHYNIWAGREESYFIETLPMHLECGDYEEAIWELN